VDSDSFNVSIPLQPSEALDDSADFSDSENLNDSLGFGDSATFETSRLFRSSSSFLESHLFGSSGTFLGSQLFGSSNSFSHSLSFIKSVEFVYSNFFHHTPSFSGGGAADGSVTSQMTLERIGIMAAGGVGVLVVVIGAACWISGRKLAHKSASANELADGLNATDESANIEGSLTDWKESEDFRFENVNPDADDGVCETTIFGTMSTDIAVLEDALI
jgi:hypothetical protein